MRTSTEANAQALTPLVLIWGSWTAATRVALTSAAHYFEGAFQWQLVIGLASCAIFGALYAWAARRSMRDALWHGGMVGWIGAFVGTAAAVMIADQPASALLLGTLAGTGAGAAGGAAAHALLTR